MVARSRCFSWNRRGCNSLHFKYVFRWFVPPFHQIFRGIHYLSIGLSSIKYCSSGSVHLSIGLYPLSKTVRFLYLNLTFCSTSLLLMIELYTSFMYLSILFLKFFEKLQHYHKSNKKAALRPFCDDRSSINIHARH